MVHLQSECPALTDQEAIENDGRWMMDFIHNIQVPRFNT